MPKTSRSLVLAVLACLTACSGDGNRSRLRVGEEGDGRADAGGASGAGSGGFGMQPSGGQAGGSGTRVSQNPLSVRVEDLEEMEIEIVTVSCAGECADVRAVAHGGNPPYSFAWDDGSTDPERELCPNESTSYEVTATDTPIVADEFNYEGTSKTARVTANVLDCSDDAGAPDAMIPPEGSCIDLEEMSPAWDLCPPSPELRDPSTGVEVPACDLGGPESRSYVRLASYDGAPLEQESLGGILCAPLRANVATSIAYMLAPGPLQGADPLTDPSFDTFAIDLWGGSSPCDKGELLWRSAPLPRTGWTCISFTPTRDHSHIHAVIRMQGPAWAFQQACMTVAFEDRAAVCAM